MSTLQTIPDILAKRDLKKHHPLLFPAERNEWDFQVLLLLLEGLPKGLTASRISEGSDNHYWNITMLNGQRKTKVIRMTITDDIRECYLELLQPDLLETLIERQQGMWIFPYPTKTTAVEDEGVRVRSHISDVAKTILCHMQKWSTSPEMSLAIRHVPLLLHPKSIRSWHLRMADCKTLDSFVNKLHGWKRITVMPNTPGAEPISDGTGRSLRTLMWIPSWFQVLDGLSATHCQLDCSFKAAAPYVYCIPQLVVYNTSVPMGLIIAPTEATAIYTELWQFMKEIEEKLNKVGRILPNIILSDMGQALKSFCENQNLTQFICHRHILESFGSNSHIMNIVRKVIESLTSEELENRIKQALFELEEYLARNKISKDQLDKFGTLIGANLSVNADGSIKKVDLSNYVDIRSRWFIGDRGGISRCSNHAETNHGHINSDINRNMSFQRRVEVLVARMCKQFESFIKRTETRTSRVIPSLQKHKEKYKTSYDSTCTCAFGERNALMYGCAHLCSHTITEDPFPCRKVTLSAWPEIAWPLTWKYHAEVWKLPQEKSTRRQDPEPIPVMIQVKDRVPGPSLSRMNELKILVKDIVKYKSLFASAVVSDFLLGKDMDATAINGLTLREFASLKGELSEFCDAHHNASYSSQAIAQFSGYIVTQLPHWRALVVELQSCGLAEFEETSGVDLLRRCVHSDDGKELTVVHIVENVMKILTICRGISEKEKTESVSKAFTNVFGGLVSAYLSKVKPSTDESSS